MKSSVKVDQQQSVTVLSLPQRPYDWQFRTIWGIFAIIIGGPLLLAVTMKEPVVLGMIIPIGIAVSYILLTRLGYLKIVIGEEEVRMVHVWWIFSQTLVSAALDSAEDFQAVPHPGGLGRGRVRLRLRKHTRPGWVSFGEQMKGDFTEPAGSSYPAEWVHALVAEANQVLRQKSGRMVLSGGAAAALLPGSAASTEAFSTTPKSAPREIRIGEFRNRDAWWIILWVVMGCALLASAKSYLFPYPSSWELTNRFSPDDLVWIAVWCFIALAQGCFTLLLFSAWWTPVSILRLSSTEAIPGQAVEFQWQAAEHEERIKSVSFRLVATQTWMERVPRRTYRVGMSKDIHQREISSRPPSTIGTPQSGIFVLDEEFMTAIRRNRIIQQGKVGEAMNCSDVFRREGLEDSAFRVAFEITVTPRFGPSYSVRVPLKIPGLD